MNNLLKKPAWSPYPVGIGIGLLATLTLVLTQKSIGTSNTFVHIAGFLESLFSKTYVLESTYFKSYYLNSATIDWQFAVVVGIFFGSYIASYLSGMRQNSFAPEIWIHAFGRSRIKRAIGAFIGGTIMLFGARFAGGCTSGKAISSGLQLGLSAWIFIAALFVSGIITAQILYRK